MHTPCQNNVIQAAQFFSAEGQDCLVAFDHGTDKLHRAGAGGWLQICTHNMSQTNPQLEDNARFYGIIKVYEASNMIATARRRSILYFAH